MKNDEHFLSHLSETMDFLTRQGIHDGVYETGIILGTALGRLVDEIEIEKELNYANIPNFPVATVEFHNGKLIFGKLRGRKVIAMQGRFHYYEGYTMQQVTFPVRVMKLLGVRTLLISNAAGSMSPDFKKGELMVIDDHINLLPDNPLFGINHEELGPRFPDMCEPYSHFLNNHLLDIAGKNEIPLHKGVYVAVAGPQLETRAEYRFLRMIGADAVGMSTVPEVIVANHMNMACAAVSVITDECDPDNLQKVDIEEIIETAGKAEPMLIKLFTELIQQIPEHHHAE